MTKLLPVCLAQVHCPDLLESQLTEYFSQIRYCNGFLLPARQTVSYAPKSGLLISSALHNVSSLLPCLSLYHMVVASV